FLGEKNNPWTKFVSRAPWTIGSDHDIATAGQHFGELTYGTRPQPRARDAHHTVAKSLNRVGKQISITTGANEGCTISVGEKAPQNEWKDEQAIVPKRSDIIFSHRSTDDTRPVIDFVAQSARPNLQQVKAKRDQPSRKPTFDFQCFLRLADALCCPQRYVCGFGSPIWSRIRQTTVSTTAATESGRLDNEGIAGITIAPASSSVTILRA